MASPHSLRPTDRLFRLVQLVRGRRLSTARYLADRLEVSLRTVYRDVAHLQAQGIPIEGEAGVGYRMGRDFALPPLMVTEEEGAALVASVRLAQALLDAPSALAAETALSKIMAILPQRARIAAEQSPLYAPTFKINARDQNTLATLRQASQTRHKVRIAYLNAADLASNRVVWPLACFYWGKVWTLAAWCETRQDFRSFRLDRITELTSLETHFPLEKGKSLADYLRQVGAPS
jgi:predicted DNA-binding transcriptional regulator YafY